MNNLKVVTIILSFMTILVGCATQATSTAKHIKPTERKNQNEIVVNKPFETVWSELIRQLSKSFYVINNVEKESRLINVSFSTDTPENYIDCGTTERTFKKGSVLEAYVYDTAADSSYKNGRKPNNSANITVVDYIQRQTDLSGRINIFVAPVSDNKTEVNVNTKYVFTVKVNGQSQGINVYETIVATQEIDVPPTTVNFTTNIPGKSADFECISKGVMESEIIDMVNAI